MISAGTNLQINAGSLTNIGSLIAAGNNATIAVAGPVVNEAQVLNAYWHSHWVQETGMFSSDKRHDSWACGTPEQCKALYGSAYTSTGGTIDPPTPVGNIAATIQAPNLSISSNGQIRNVGNVLGTYVSLTGQKLINGVALLGPGALTAAALGGAYDYAGNAYSYLAGLSKDAPDLGNSYIAGLVAGAAYPFTIADGVIAGMSRIGKIAANGYNAAVAGTAAFGAAGMTRSSPDAPAAAATIATAAGSGAKEILPGRLGNALNQMIQGAAGPLQNVIQKALGQ